MTFNIRYGTADDGDNAWPLRRGLLSEVVEDFGPDIMGVQEGLALQLQELAGSLPDHDWLGVGRDDGKAAGEFSAIFYRKTRFDLLEEGTFWFSDTPEVPGSMTWGNSLPRICTWARFLDRRARRTVVVFNLHWDHQSQPSRERAALLLLQRIRSRAHPEDWVIVTGDFNAGETNPAFRSLVASTDPSLQDSYRVLHPDSEAVGTFHGFQGGGRGRQDRRCAGGSRMAGRDGGNRAGLAERAFSVRPLSRDGRFVLGPPRGVAIEGGRFDLADARIVAFQRKRRLAWKQAKRSSIGPGGT